MYATNNLADRFNQDKLSRLCAEEGLQKVAFRAKFTDQREEYAIKDHPRVESFKARAIDEAGFAHNTMLAVGAQVLITSNEPEEKRYVNGDIGILEDMTFEVHVKGAIEEDHYGDPIKWRAGMRWGDMSDEERDRMCMMLLGNATTVRPISLSVCLERTGGLVTVGLHDVVTSSAIGKAVHSVSGFPVRLGYAVTIHKAQGMTVDKAWLDMDSIKSMPEEGRHGLAYVGLSRVRTLEGLGVGSWTPDVVVCAPEVLPLI